MSRRTKLLILYLVAVVGMGVYAAQQVPYDQCLDAGGMIDYAHRLCVTEEGARPLREFDLAVVGLSILGLVILPMTLWAALRALTHRRA